MVPDWRKAQRAWAREFDEDRRRSGRTLEAVAHEVGVALNTLSNYRDARSRLAPQLLAPLAASVGGSALKWATILGYLPEDLYLAGQALERAKREMRDLQEQLLQLRQDGTTTGSIVTAASVSGRWSLAVEPWFEGPDACRLRAGDLVRIRSVDGRRFTAGELRGERLLSEALTLSSAIRQPTGVWGGDPRPIQDASTDLREEWIWAVPYLLVHYPAARVPCQLDVRGIAVFCPLLAGWPGDVAALIGRALGWTTTATGVLANTELGEDLREVPFTQPDSRKAQARAAIAADLLAHSLNTGSTVWAHVTRGAHRPFAELLQRCPSDDLVVYLRPSDLLCESLVRRWPQRHSIAGFFEARAMFDEALEASDLNRLVVEVGYPSDLEVGSDLTRAKRDAYFERSLLAALQVLEYLRANFGGPPLQQLHENTPPEFAALARSLADEPDRLWTNEAPCTRGRRFL